MLKSLEKIDLIEGDVQIVNVPAQNVLEELKKGNIFAGHVYEPFVSNALKQDIRFSLLLQMSQGL